MPPAPPPIGSIVKVHPRIAEDPNQYVGRGTYLGTEGGVHRIRPLPHGPVRMYDAADFEVSQNVNAPPLPPPPAPTIPVPVGMPAAPMPMLGGRVKKRSTTRRRRHTRSRKHSRKH